MPPLFLFLLFCSSIFAAETITVDPRGPIKTLDAARDAARLRRQQGFLDAIVIQVRGGRYFHDAPLALSREDHDLTIEAAAGDSVVLSGGRVVSGWKKGEKSIWTASTVGLQPFRQLFVSGRRALLARTPNFGFYRIDGPSSQDKPFRLKFRGNDIKPEWAGTDTEVIALLAWADLRMPIKSVADGYATLASDPRPSNKENDARYWIENAPDGLDSAGEWRFDAAAQTVSYWPLAGEDMSKEEFIAPQLRQLVKIDGAQRVTFRGLQFVHTDWAMPPKGYADTQAAVAAEATFEAVHAREITIEKCQFRHLGNYAISFGRGSQNNRMVRNEIYDIGAGGIRVGEPVQRADEADRNFNNEIIDNHIHHLGYVNPPAVGVFILQSSRNHVAHNNIHDLYYTAISVGWTWGYGPNQSKENVIEFNHLHHIGLEMLSDMGGIYTLGMQPGSVLRNNLIHDIAAFTYGGWGIYPDEGTSHMLIENNVVYRCASSGFHQHYGRENVVRNNIFAFNRDFQLMRTRVEPHLSFTFERNIVIFDRGRLLGSNWTGDQFRMNHNVYFDVRGGPIRFGGRTWEEWRASGKDADSMIGDPLFVNAGSLDFRLRKESMALKMGFQPIDLSQVGPRPER